MQKRLVVTLSDQGRSQLDATLNGLTGAGLTVDSVLKSTGIVTGSADIGRLDHLRRVDGVSTVEGEGSIQLPSPESDLQ